jgi:glucan phosphorylase
MRWLEVMRRAMATALWQFSTTRMLHEYVERLYLPAAGITASDPTAAPAVTEAG